MAYCLNHFKPLIPQPLRYNGNEGNAENEGGSTTLNPSKMGTSLSYG